jgi:2-polyprenyl-6-methoxyphenol hydroxylase-like FAD-dependent oxidoreductase
MGPSRYDLLIVGGGIAGAALAAAMAGEGRQVLLLERQARFRDRIRGEAMMPWGVQEATTLGLLPAFQRAAARATPYWTTWIDGQPTPPQDFGPTAGGPGFLAMSHPALQEALVRHAATRGAELLRGATVESVVPGHPVRAQVVGGEGRARPVTARLLVGAEGRSGVVAQAVGAEARRDPRFAMTIGLELSGDFDSGAAVNFFLDLESGWSAIVARTAPERCRAYLVHHAELLPRGLAGEGDRPQVLALLRRAGVPADWLAGESPRTPLASFDGAWRWVQRPTGPGVVLVGDAAGASDPAWGNGLSRTLRDVRLLRDHLLADADWDRAVAAYAEEHLAFCQRLRVIEQAQAALFLTPGPEAAARRRHALGLMARDPSRQPDLLRLGPDAPFDEPRRRRFFGEI